MTKGTSSVVFAGLMALGLIFGGAPRSHAESPPPAGRPQIPLLDGEWRHQTVTNITDQPGEKWTKITNSRLLISIPKDRNALWLERTVGIPAEWKGRRVMLHVSYLQYGAKVFVNGVEAGELLAYGDELDLAPHVRYGEDNTLRFLFPRAGEGIQTMDTFSKAIILSTRADEKEALLRQVGITSTSDQFCLESRPVDIAIEDVWYRSYVRGYQRLNPQVEIQTTKRFDGVKAKLVITDTVTGKTVREAEYALPTLASGANVQSLPLIAGDLKLWALREPNLYWGQVVLYDGAGLELDRSNPVQFGIREFWVQGKEFYLNNKPVHFVLGRPYLKWRSLADMFNAGITLKEIGMSGFMRDILGNHAYTINACDTNGIACMTSGVIANSMFDACAPDIKDPTIIRDYTTWVKHHQRRLRNHPSIFFYGLTACCGGSSVDFAPTTLGTTSRVTWNYPDVNTAHLIQKELDPTRVYYVHGGPLVGDISTGLIYFNHIPYQEVEDWLSEWSEKGDRPVIANEFSGTKMYVDFCKGRLSYATEYDAMYSGDHAYATETDDYIRYAGNTWLKGLSVWDYDPFRYNTNIVSHTIEGLVRTHRAWRFRGAAYLDWIWNPEFGKGSGHNEAIWRAYLEWIKPIQIWIGGAPDRWTEKDHNFFSGDKISKSVMVIRDLNGPELWNTVWSARLSGQDKAMAGGQFEKLVTAYTRETWPIQFTAPDVKTPTPLELTCTVTANDGKTEIGKGAFAMTIYPQTPAPAGRERKGWAIVDPEGETTAWLKTQGVAVPPLNKAGGGINTLILGRRALKTLRTPPFTAQDIEQGMRVVVFEQPCADLVKSGFRMEDRCPRYVFPRMTDHPLIQGLPAESLRDWRGDATLFSRGPDRDQDMAKAHFYHWGNRGNVASAIIETPHFGPFWSLMDCEFDLGFSPLVAWRHGKGEIIYCLLDLTGRVGMEPGATIAANNLVRYLDTPPAGPEQIKTVIGLDADTVKRMEALGFAAQPWSGRPDPKRQVVVINGVQAEALAKHRADVASFAKAGGDVLILAANEALIADPFFDGKLQAKDVQVSRAARQVDAHPLLRGVGSQQIHWREVVRMKALESKDAHYTSLLGGLMGTLAYGHGRIVLLQTDPAAMKDVSAMEALGPLPDLADKKDKPIDAKQREYDRKRSVWQLNRLHGLVLANLGVRSHDALASRLFDFRKEMRYVPVDRWVYLGVFPPPDDVNTNCLSEDLSSFVKQRDMSAKFSNSRGQSIQWYFPTDFNNGLGIGGLMDFSKHYPRQLRDMVVAVTQIWSTRERMATIRFGADWWLKIDVNGKEVFRTDDKTGGFAVQFDNERKIPLKAGWNDVVCTVGAGSNGHVLWFKISDPGDVRVEQSITSPAGKPKDLPPVADLAEENAPPGFSLYADPISSDPYGFIPW